MDDKDSQCKIILVWLKEKGYINAKIARQLCACERLDARINDPDPDRDEHIYQQ